MVLMSHVQMNIDECRVCLELVTRALPARARAGPNSEVQGSMQVFIVSLNKAFGNVEISHDILNGEK